MPPLFVVWMTSAANRDSNRKSIAEAVTKMIAFLLKKKEKVHPQVYWKPNLAGTRYPALRFGFPPGCGLLTVMRDNGGESPLFQSGL